MHARFVLHMSLLGVNVHVVDSLAPPVEGTETRLNAQVWWARLHARFGLCLCLFGYSCA